MTSLLREPTPADARGMPCTRLDVGGPELQRTDLGPQPHLRLGSPVDLSLRLEGAILMHLDLTL